MTTSPASEQPGPSWDNSSEYRDFRDPVLFADSARIRELAVAIAAQSDPLQKALQSLDGGGELRAEPDIVSLAQQIASQKIEALILLGNVRTFATCAVSVDGQSEPAKELVNLAQGLSAQLGEALQPLNLWLVWIDQTSLEAYLSAAHTAPERFQIEWRRLLKPTYLPLAEEQLLKALEVHGPMSWATLYNNLSSNLVCRVERAGSVQELGLAEASSLLESAEAHERRAAFGAIDRAWTSVEEAAAASVNSLAGWRLEVCRKRAHTVPVHFLDGPIHQNAISRETLTALMEAVKDARPMIRGAITAQAKALGLASLHPSDLFAPPPVTSGGRLGLYPYDEAIALIKDAFAGIDPAMAEFVDVMVANRWIEGSVGRTKRPGAYCTKFLKSRTPRVYMTYTGGMKDVTTLAHELGHAFHNWVMRDLATTEIIYPMTLAETASIFAQTVVNEALLARAKTDDELMMVAWADAREAESLLINVPARFAFEAAFYERRKERPLSPRALKALMAEIWCEWYGETMSEANAMFWASKLHFHIAELSFYNFPYTFGYLFSLGVYAERERLGRGFYRAYVDLLRDTGRMTAEDLAAKHLGVDLTRADFWQRSLAIVAKKVDHLARLVE